MKTIDVRIKYDSDTPLLPVEIAVGLNRVFGDTYDVRELPAQAERGQEGRCESCGNPKCSYSVFCEIGSKILAGEIPPCTDWKPIIKVDCPIAPAKTEFEKQIGFEMHEGTGNPGAPDLKQMMEDRFARRMQDDCPSCEKLKAENAELKTKLYTLRVLNKDTDRRIAKVQEILERTFKQAKGEE